MIRTFIVASALGVMALYSETSLAQSVPTVGINLVQDRVSEDGSRIGGFQVAAQGTLDQALTVRLRIQGTATPDADYVAIPASVTLTPDTPVINLMVVPIQDEIVEMDETVLVGLEEDDAFQIGNGGPVTITIRDDDLSDGEITDAILDNNAGVPNRLIRAVADRFGELCASAREDRIEALRSRCRAFRRALRSRDVDQILRVRDALRQVMNEEVASQGRVLAEINRSQIGHIANRLAALRGGVSGFSLAGLTIQSPDQNIPVGAMMAANAGGDPADALLSGSRWGAFISGSIGDGDADGNDLEPGFDFDTWSITGGVDYRFDGSWIGGAAISLSQLDSDFELSAGTLEEDGWALEMYLSYAGDNWFLDGSLGYGKTDFDQTRGINYTLTDDGQDFSVDDVLFSSTESDSILASLAYGWDLRADTWTWGPRARLDYASSDIDGFAESSLSGSDAFAVEVQGQEADSLLLRAGLAAYGAFSQDWGILQPQAELYFNHETENDSRIIRSRFPGAGSGGPVFAIPTGEVDANYGTFSIGLTAVYPQGRQLYLNYYRVFSQDAYDQQILQFGGRIEF